MRRILVVDDEADVALLFQQRFRQEIRTHRLALHFALSGEQALAYLEEQAAESILVILSDINMPGMDGLEFLRHVKRRFPWMQVFMITAYSDPELYQRARCYGARDCLTKPLDFAALKEKIQAL